MDALVLSSAYAPLRFESAAEAATLVHKGRCEVVHSGDQVVRSAEQCLPVPLTIRFLSKSSAFFTRKVKFSRNNIWLRDRGKCQYCPRRVSRKSMELEHVVPRAQGGRTSWSNIVASCSPCNKKKANRTPEQAGMPLHKAPVRPKTLPGNVPFDMEWREDMPECWRDFLMSVAYWTAELEEG